ncbi:MAG: helix-turn-helix domain-containing protein, partial [Actinobacteria bacterium]|nr:helix-turn-helix domain-containing protein [Actinomycetota bacterium]
MNLKAAARRLGLHYQTAYRYVRSGELVAVKLGATYEVSEAAIEQFRRHRHELSELSSEGEFIGEHDQHATSPLEALRADLALMLDRTTLSAQPVFDRIVRHAITEIGDGCVLRLLADDGAALRTAAVAHLDPTAHSLLAAIQDSPLPLSLDDHELEALRDGGIQRVDFLRQDAARRMIPREFLQYGDQLRFFGLLAVPVRNAGGAVVGLLTITRSRAGWAFDDQAEACARELADWAAAAHTRLATARAGWKARSSIHRAVEVVLAIDPTQLAAQLDSLLSGLAGVSVGAAALSTDGTLLAA